MRERGYATQPLIDTIEDLYHNLNRNTFLIAPCPCLKRKYQQTGIYHLNSQTLYKIPLFYRYLWTIHRGYLTPLFNQFTNDTVSCHFILSVYVLSSPMPLHSNLRRVCGKTLLVEEM